MFVYFWPRGETNEFLKGIKLEEISSVEGAWYDYRI